MKVLNIITTQKVEDSKTEEAEDFMALEDEDSDTKAEKKKKKRKKKTKVKETKAS